MNIQKIYEDRHYKVLFEEFYHPLVRFAFQYTSDRERAEDIVQEVFISMWHKKPAFDDLLQLRTYLYRSVQRKCLNYLRDLRVRRRHEQLMADTPQHEEPTVIRTLIREEVYRQLQASVEQLPPQCKKICLLILEGKKPSEVARELNLAVETVKKQRKIALQRLQNELSANPHDDPPDEVFFSE